MKLYRFIDYINEPWLMEFDVIKTTKCGHWIMDNWIWPNKKRWINSSTRKQYAYDTKEKALIGYIKRKEKLLLILESKIEEIEKMLKMAKNIDLSVKLLTFNGVF